MISGTCFFGSLFSFAVPVLAAGASISSDLRSRISVMPLLSASNSILNLCNS